MNRTVKLYRLTFLFYFRQVNEFVEETFNAFILMK